MKGIFGKMTKSTKYTTENTCTFHNCQSFIVSLTWRTHPVYFSWKTSCCWYNGSKVLLAVAVLAFAKHRLPLTKYTFTQGAKKHEKWLKHGIFHRNFITSLIAITDMCLSVSFIFTDLVRFLSQVYTAVLWPW